MNPPFIANETRNFVDEHVLMPTLHWTAYYNHTNPLCLPLANITESIEKNKKHVIQTHPIINTSTIYLHWIKKLLKTFTAPRANDFSIEYYDHKIIRPNQDQFFR